MDEMGYDYVAFGDFHFKDDLQFEDAVPMLERLQRLAEEKGVTNWRFKQGQEPGLKSVAIATGTPAFTMSRAGAKTAPR